MARRRPRPDEPSGAPDGPARGRLSPSIAERALQKTLQKPALRRWHVPPRLFRASIYNARSTHLPRLTELGFGRLSGAVSEHLVRDHLLQLAHGRNFPTAVLTYHCRGIRTAPLKREPVAATSGAVQLDLHRFNRLGRPGRSHMSASPHDRRLSALHTDVN